MEGGKEGRKGGKKGKQTCGRTQTKHKHNKNHRSLAWLTRTCLKRKVEPQWCVPFLSVSCRVRGVMVDSGCMMRVSPHTKRRMAQSKPFCSMSRRQFAVAFPNRPPQTKKATSQTKAASQKATKKKKKKDGRKKAQNSNNNNKKAKKRKKKKKERRKALLPFIARVSLHFISCHFPHWQSKAPSLSTEVALTSRASHNTPPNKKQPCLRKPFSSPPSLSARVTLVRFFLSCLWCFGGIALVLLVSTLCPFLFFPAIYSLVVLFGFLLLLFLPKARKTHCSLLPCSCFVVNPQTRSATRSRMPSLTNA